MQAIPEFGYAVAIRNVPEAGLAVGDVGVVVDVHGPPDQPIGYTLEIFNVSGQSVAVVSVPADALRLAEATDRVAARPVAAE